MMQQHDDELSTQYAIRMDSLLHRRGWKMIGSGLHRNVYARGGAGRYVIKVPRNSVGALVNRNEVRYSQDERSSYRCAATAYMFGGPSVVQERLEPIHIPVNLPEWVAWIDSAQVGYDSNGAIKAYDFGC